MAAPEQDLLEEKIQNVRRGDRRFSRNREYAADQFGPMADLVFERWGVRSMADFGEIVFNLIDAELLSRRPTDSRLDFVDSSDFRAAFAAKHRESLDRIAST